MSRILQLKIKRAFDLLVSLILLIVIAPFLLFIAVLVKLSSPGAAIFRQKRPGLNGKIFTIYKFRTMQLGSDTMFKGKEVELDDPRITTIGRVLRRTKIDELPQLVNVIKGEMSLVGPRPERIESLAEYSNETCKRLEMRPGMTGLAQVSGNIYLKLKSRYLYDIYYVNNYSLLLDLKILVRTIGVVFYGEGKYINKPLLYLPETKIIS